MADILNDPVKGTYPNGKALVKRSNTERDWDNIGGQW